MYVIAYIPMSLVAAFVVALAVAPPDPIVTIPPGKFRMGASAADLERATDLCTRALRATGALDAEIGPRCRTRAEIEGSPAEIFVSGYAIDRTEVTFGAYRACVLAGACPELPRWLAARAQRMPQHPAEEITFLEAARYCGFRHGRLPSEAEWERAARGNDVRFFPWGDEPPGNHRANLGAAKITPFPAGMSGGEAPSAQAEHDGDGHPRAAPAGSFPRGASGFGVLDLGGNVWEWTASIFAARPVLREDTTDPRGPPSGDERVLRGGGYLSPPDHLRVTARFSLPATARVPAVGFRCVYGRPAASRPAGR